MASNILDYVQNNGGFSLTDECVLGRSGSNIFRERGRKD
jgi:hypothetical protein